MSNKRTVIIRPTLRCNAKCDYCYVNNKHGTMSIELLGTIVSRLEEFVNENSDEKIAILWHGGEPSLMPITFWENVEALLRNFDQTKLTKHVQTNLLHSDFAKYKWFIEHDYRISSSLDGSYEVHSQGRKLSKQRYTTLIKNIELVKKQAGSLGVVCVVSRLHIQKPQEHLEFFENLGVNVTFNMIRTKDEKFRLSYAEFYDFLLNVADAWLCNPGSQISVNPIETDIAALFKDRKSICDRSQNCFSNFITIDPTGATFPCNRFADHPEWECGNINSKKLKTLWDQTTQRMSFLIDSLQQCPSCDWYDLCGGGCKWLRLKENADEQNDFCQSTHTYFSRLSKKISEYHV